MNLRTHLFCLAAGAALLLQGGVHGGSWVEYAGKEGPGKGKRLVFVTGDEEYRSEEGMPMLAKILSQRHGFDCTVLFAINPATGEIDPNNQTNIVGMSAVKGADLVFLFNRFRELPDDQMKFFVDYMESGKPVVGIRTSTHAFAYSRNKKSPYAKYDWQSREWPGGFGQQVLGDTWISHHGHHGKESTRGVINPEFKGHALLRGVEDIWGPTDVYGIIHLPKEAKVLVHGQILVGMKPDDKPLEGPKNNPMMPLIWERTHTWPNGNTSHVLGSTIGAATDLESEGLRRLFVNAAYVMTGLEGSLPEKADVRYVGEYTPTPFGFNGFKKGVMPSDHELK